MTWTNSPILQNNPVVATPPRFYVTRSGIYSITFSLGANPSSGDVELFISKNLGNNNDLNPTATNQLLSSSRIFTKESITWTGYVNAFTDYLSVGAYTDFEITLSPFTHLTISLIDGAEGPTGPFGPTGPSPSTSTLQGSITLSSTSTPPTLGTRTVEQVSYTRIGDRYRVRYRLGWAAGTAGSGEYLIHLPAGLIFNTGASYNPIYTGALWSPTVSAMAPYLIPISGGVIQSGSWSTISYVIPYSSSQFRLILTSSQDTSFGTWSSTRFPVSAEGTLQLEYEIWQ
jgi:hypothetical protein